MIHYAIALTVVALVLAGLLPVIAQSLADQPLYMAEAAFTWDNYVRLFTEAAFGDVIRNSLVLAVLTTVMAVPMGVLLAVLVQRVGIPGGRLFETIILIPLFISPLVVAFGFVIAYGPAGYVTSQLTRAGISIGSVYSIPGMAVASTITLIPIVYQYTSNSIRRIDPRLEDAARSAGMGPLRLLRSITLPLLRPSIAYSAVLAFTLSLEELSIPLIYGPPARKQFFTSFIFEKGFRSTTVDYGIVGAACVFLFAILTVLVVLQMLSLRKLQRFTTVRGKGAAERRLEVGSLRWLGFAIVLVYALLGPVVPALAVAARAFTKVLSPLISPLDVLTLQNFTGIFEVAGYRSAIVNSVTVALIAAAVTTLLMALTVFVARRSTFRFARQLELVAFAPLSFPGIIVGFGLFYVFLLVPALGSLRGTVLALVIAFSIRAFPVAFGALSPGVLQIGQELDQAARAVGADWWRTVRSVLFRLVLPIMVATYFLLFASMVRAYSEAIFLSDGDSQVMGQVALAMWQSGASGQTAALSFIQIAIAVAATGVGRLVAKGNKHA
ncbi:iron ABC transporter permease [Streptomyces sp. NPDC050625]|uniref:ABC transporter permease n=1 Tax=Streptomyces sp. NPDC050625 TaxID=3154629 RepID=UPI003436D81A